MQKTNNDKNSRNLHSSKFQIYINFAIKQDRWFYLLVEEPLLDDAPEVREPPDDIPPPLVREEEEPDGRLIVLLEELRPLLYDPEARRLEDVADAAED